MTHKYGFLHTPDAMVDELRAKGFYLYRENFMWGRSDGFRNDAGNLLYVERGVVRTDAEQFDHLKSDWQPMAMDDVRYFECCIAAGKLI